jgi:hypothetical protein
MFHVEHSARSHQGTVPAWSNRPPVGPSSGSVASLIAILAPFSGVSCPWKSLNSVATYPGQAPLTLMPVSSLAYWTVMAFRNVFDGV